MKYILPSILAIFLIASCQKETDENVRTTKECEVTKQFMFDDAGAIYDSARYTYNSDKITKVAISEGYITFEYSNEKITKRSFYSANSTTLDAYDAIAYNSDGTISKIVQYSEFMGAMEKYKELVFSYTSGKLSSLKMFEPDGMGLIELDTELTYQYTGNNATQVLSKSYIQGNLDEIYTLSLKFDTNPNYFTKIDKQIFLTDPFQYEFEGLSLITLVSQNNIIKIEYPDNPNDEDDVLSYTADSNGNLATFGVNGTKGLAFFFKCP
jgi:hypothetical protein